MNDKKKEQQRIWVSILYCDNDEHNIALTILKDSFPGSILMKHNREGKEHYHCVIRSDMGLYKGWLLKKLYLDFDVNEHLFRSLKDIKFKRLDKYLLYLTHYDVLDKPFYSPENFEGTDRLYAIDCVNDILSDPSERFHKVINYIPIYFSDLDNKFKYDTQIYNDFYKEFGSIIYKKWGMIRSFINEYKNLT